MNLDRQPPHPLTRRVRRVAHGIRARARRMFSSHFALRLTVEGWCLVATMLLIGLAALNTAAPLLYLMFSMMCAFFILSALLATNTMHGISVSRRVPRLWQARSPLHVEVYVTNSKFFTASYSLRLSDIMTDGTIAGAAFFDQVPPRKVTVRQEYICFFRRRGVYRMDHLQLATRFPFGLIERTISFPSPGEILVLPQTIDVSKRMEQAQTQLGDFQSVRKGQGSGLYGLNYYTPDMPARDIHWKVSARRGNLIVREYESEERRRAIVVLDNRVPRERQREMSEQFEKSVVLAASVVEWLCQRQHEVELRTASGIVGFGTGQGHLTRCRRSLARLEMVEPPQGDAALLFGGEEGAVVFPVLMTGSASTAPGRIPLGVADFEEDLHRAFEFKAPSGAFPSGDMWSQARVPL